jgi:hypothetical protein
MSNLAPPPGRSTDSANASFPELAASSAFTLVAYGQAQHDLDD